LNLLYTPCILDCALRFLIKFSTYLSKKKKKCGTEEKQEVIAAPNWYKMYVYARRKVMDIQLP